MNRRWPDSRTAFWNPDLKNGARRREFYEDRDARSSILARSMAAKPDTLKQTDDLAHSIKPLADGAGHTFLKVIFSLAKKHQIVTQPTWTLRAASLRLMSYSGKSGAAATRASSQSRSSLRREWRSPPIGLGAMLPVCRNRCAHLTTLLTEMLNCFAAARQLAPAP